MKERFFDLLVNTYYNAHLIGDLSEVILDETDPYGEFICELLGISEDEYMDMLNEALEKAEEWESQDMIKQLKNRGYIR